MVKWPTIPPTDEITVVEPDAEEDAGNHVADEDAIAVDSKDDVVIPDGFEPKVRASICLSVVVSAVVYYIFFPFGILDFETTNINNI